MQRNSLKLRLEYKWLQRGKAFGKFNMPFIERSDIFVLYRGIYDSIYDTTPGQIETNRPAGRSRSPRTRAASRASTKDTRDDLKFNNPIREAYMDMYFKSLPLTLRIGKQQVVWGESDGFRMLDRANTLDLSWHFFQELPPPGFGFDELRQPFFMVKGLWDFKQIGPLSQTFLESYWNPGSTGTPARSASCRVPGACACSIRSRTRQGTGVFQSSFCRTLPTGRLRLAAQRHEAVQPGQLRDEPDRQQPVRRALPLHHAARHGVSRSTTCTSASRRTARRPRSCAAFRPTDKTFVNDTSPAPGNQSGYLPNEQYCQGLSDDAGQLSRTRGRANQFCAEYFAPYIHTVGLSFNWFEGDWTQTVWRVETIVDFDLPFYDGDKQIALFGRSPNGPTLLPGITKRNMWKGMLAFDRPTWIRWLNKKTTFFLSGQLFWHYIIDMERRRCAIDDQPGVPRRDGTKNPNFIGYTSSPHARTAATTRELLLPGEQTGFVGPLDLPKLERAGRQRPRHDPPVGNADDLRGSRLLPRRHAGAGPDLPARSGQRYSQELALGVDWFYTPDLAFNVTTRLIWVGAPWDAVRRPQEQQRRRQRRDLRPVVPRRRQPRTFGDEHPVHLAVLTRRQTANLPKPNGGADQSAPPFSFALLPGAAWRGPQRRPCSNILARFARCGTARGHLCGPLDATSS